MESKTLASLHNYFTLLTHILLYFVENITHKSIQISICSILIDRTTCRPTITCMLIKVYSVKALDHNFFVPHKNYVLSKCFSFVKIKYILALYQQEMSIATIKLRIRILFSNIFGIKLFLCKLGHNKLMFCLVITYKNSNG